MRRVVFALIMAIVIISVFTARVFARANTITSIPLNRPFIWADDEDYWPAIYRGKNGNPRGIFNDILTEVFKRLHIPLKKAVYPWKRAQELVKDGKADGMVTVWTKERQKFTVATEPIWYINETLLFRSDNPKACKILKINSFKELRNFVVVETQGSGWSKEEFEKYKIKNVIWVPTVESALNMVAKKRADIYIMPSFDACRILLRKKDVNNPLSVDYRTIVAITPSFAKLPFRLLIRKSSPFAGKVNDINKVLEMMKRDGTYQRILNKYISIVPPL